MRARTQFVGIELGDRWGSWGARAVTFLRVFNSMLPYDLQSNPTPNTVLDSRECTR